MKYSLTERGQQTIQRNIDALFKGETYIDMTEIATSPYNIKQMLLSNDFIETFIDNNGMDYWWGFYHPKVGSLTMFFSAESFEIILDVQKGDND